MDGFGVFVFVKVIGRRIKSGLRHFARNEPDGDTFFFTRRPFCILLRYFDGLATAFVCEQGPDAVAAGTAEQTQLTVADLPLSPQKVQHRRRLGAFQPLGFGHGVTPSARSPTEGRDREDRRTCRPASRGCGTLSPVSCLCDSVPAKLPHRALQQGPSWSARSA